MGDRGGRAEGQAIRGRRLAHTLKARPKRGGRGGRGGTDGNRWRPTTFKEEIAKRSEKPRAFFFVEGSEAEKRP